MDIKEIVEKILNEIGKDENLLEQFEKEPVKVIENVTGVDLPDDLVEKVIEGVKNGNLDLDKATDTLDQVEDVLEAVEKVDLSKVSDVLDKVGLNEAADLVDKVDDVADTLQKASGIISSIKNLLK